MMKLVFASFVLLALLSPAADAEQPSRLVLEIDQRLKPDMKVDATEFHFELHADGSWSYIRTRSQAIETTATGKISLRKTQQIQRALGGAKWKISTSGISCMAFAVVTTQYKVNGRAVWTDEMCSSDHLDLASAKRLAEAMTIVTPLLAGTVK